MSDTGTSQLKERLAKVGEKALTRLQEKHPHLRGLSLEETVEALKREELRRVWGVSPFGMSVKGPIATDAPQTERPPLRRSLRNQSSQAPLSIINQVLGSGAAEAN